jgi:folate-binding protein YgfZ
VLLEKVKNKLKMYILRSKVQLQDARDEFCVSGLQCTNDMATALSLPETIFAHHNKLLKLPNAHYLLVANADDTIQFWSAHIAQGFQAQNSQLWQWLDLDSGLAWLDETSSEQHIPQMLNLDKLGGISFTKGCYTGQEVVARTHYLGKAKRELF